MSELTEAINRMRAERWGMGQEHAGDFEKVIAAAREAESLTAQLQASQQGREIEQTMIRNFPAALRAAKADAWEEGYHYIAFGGKSLADNPYRAIEQEGAE